MQDGTLTWRELVEKHHHAMVDELSAQIVSELESAVEQAIAAERSEATSKLAFACEEARRARTEALNQALRRLRQAVGEEQILRHLAEGCAPYTARSVVLVFENHQARVVAAQGYEKQFMFDIASAPAVLTAIESRDPVTALATEGELSPELANAFASVPADKAYLFPLSARHSVVAMLIAAGPALSAPIELLCEAAGMRLETLQPVAIPKPPVLIQLAATTPAGQAAGGQAGEKRSWENLSPEDQRLHLQAQRTARLRVAEMRLYHEVELRSGVANGDIYAALQTPIDSARTQFLQTYLSKSHSMVDYLHLEILRSLAQEDDRLLGQRYPGPMV